MQPAEPASDPSATLRQRAGDLHERAMLGGVFYLLSWLLVSGFGDAWVHYPVASGVLATVFLALLAARVLIRRAAQHRPHAASWGMRRQWSVLLLTAALWGALACWALLDPVFAAARTLTIIATVSLATAFAQVFAVNARLAMLGTGTLYLPMLATVLWRGDQTGVTLVLTLNLVYLVAVIGRSHREYVARLELDEALRLQRDRFAQQSRMDALTGLANRGHFQEQLNARLEGAIATGSPLALLIIDLDHFKSINDRFGHLAGDQCLRDVAALLRESFGGSDTLIARLGGEEFGVLAADADCASIGLLAETFRARLSRLRIEMADGTRFGLTASLGLTHFTAGVHDGGDALYVAADQALYRAKQGGRNRLEAA
jgi:diguanylate cyclase (GGDEF)-like protein